MQMCINPLLQTANAVVLVKFVKQTNKKLNQSSALSCFRHIYKTDVFIRIKRHRQQSSLSTALLGLVFSQDLLIKTPNIELH